MYHIFVGAYVTLAIKDLMGNSQDNRFANLMIGGVLLDECEDYLYIGSEEEVVSAIKKEQVIGVFLEDSGIGGNKEYEIPPGTVRQ